MKARGVSRTGIPSRARRPRPRGVLGLSAAVLFAALAGCGDRAATPPPPTGSPAASCRLADALHEHQLHDDATPAQLAPRGGSERVRRQRRCRPRNAVAASAACVDAGGA